MSRLGVATVTLAVLLAASGTDAQTRGVTAEDYFAFESASDPHFSPDGSAIAFVVTTVDQKQNRRANAIWRVSADGSREARRLTTSPQSSTSPRWSPDGKAIAFLSARPAANDPATETPRAQVWLLPLTGGEPRRVTALLNGVSSFQWSPDGNRLVCVSRSGPSDTAKSPSDVRHYKHVSYKFNDSGMVRRQASAPLGRGRRVRRRASRLRTATTGTTPIRNGRRTVAGWRSSRIARARRSTKPQHRRVGDRRRRRRADEDLDARGARQFAALVARRPDASRSSAPLKNERTRRSGSHRRRAAPRVSQPTVSI